MQIVILGLSTVVAHLPHFPLKLITKNLKHVFFRLRKGEILLYFSLVHGLEQALAHIQQLKAAVNLESQS